MKIAKIQLIKLIKEQISKEDKDIYEVDYVEGDYEYHSFGPSRTTWDNFWTRKGRDKHNFGKFNSPQAAKKQFLIKFPREKNYYNWSGSAARLWRNGKPIFGVGNDTIFKK